jgi:hypothetical protein
LTIPDDCIHAYLRTVQGDIRGAIDFLDKPCLYDLDKLYEALDQLRRARTIVDSLILEIGSELSKQDTLSAQADDMTREKVCEAAASTGLGCEPDFSIGHDHNS